MKIKNPQIETDHIIQSSDFQRTEKQIPQKPKNHKWPNQNIELTRYDAQFLCQTFYSRVSSCLTLA